jgi:hypothetical protein
MVWAVLTTRNALADGLPYDLISCFTSNPEDVAALQLDFLYPSRILSYVWCIIINNSGVHRTGELTDR